MAQSTGGGGMKVVPRAPVAASGPSPAVPAVETPKTLTDAIDTD
ncbi:hypothetical protein [Haloglomus halophilum]|nr:hypothetical protein [Haloglomus halophilum]